MEEQADQQIYAYIEFLNNDSSGYINDVLHIARRIPFTVKLNHVDPGCKFISIDLLVIDREGRLISVEKCIKHRREITSSDLNAIPIVMQIPNDVDKGIIYEQRVTKIAVNEMMNDITMYATCYKKCQGIESKKTFIRFRFYATPNTEDREEMVGSFDVEVFIHARKYDLNKYRNEFQQSHCNAPVQVTLQFDSKQTALVGVQSVIAVNALKLHRASENEKELCEAILEANQQEFEKVKKLRVN